MKTVTVESHQTFDACEPIHIVFTPGVLALDGDGEVIIPSGAKFAVRFNESGPLVVNIARTLELANSRKLWAGTRRSTLRRY